MNGTLQLSNKQKGGENTMQSANELYQQYSGKVYRYLLRLCGNPMMAEDLTQDAFLKAIEKSTSFKGNCAVDTWLCAIAHNCFVNATKKRENRNRSLTDTDIQSPFSIEDALADRDTAVKIHTALHSLPEPYKEVFSLRVMGELGYSEIGKIFEKNENWARVTFFRAKEKLIELLRKDAIL